MSGGRILATVLAVILAYSIGVVLLLNWDDVSNRFAQWTGNQPETAKTEQPKSDEPDSQTVASKDDTRKSGEASKGDTANETQATTQKDESKAGNQQPQPGTDLSQLKESADADTKPDDVKAAETKSATAAKTEEPNSKKTETDKTADAETKTADQKVARTASDQSDPVGTASKDKSADKMSAANDAKSATGSQDRETVSKDTEKDAEKDKKQVAANSSAERSREASSQGGDKANALAFDVVNIDKAGMGVIAGSGAEPGSRVVIESNGKVIGEEKAGDTGQWVIITDQALKAGDQLLTLKSIASDKAKESTSSQKLRVNVPDKGKTLPRVVLAETGQPDKVLQEQRTTQLAEKQPDKGIENQPPATKEKVAAGTAEKPQDKAGQKKEMLAESGSKDGTKVGDKSEQKPQVLAEKPSIGERIKNLFTSSDQEKKKPSATDEKPVQPVHKGEPIPVALVTVKSVEYERSVENSGFLTLNGEGLPKTRIKLFLGGNPIGSTRVDDQGTWSFYKKIIIKPGKHMIRAEQVDQAGKTLALVNHAFERALPKSVTIARVNADPDDTKAEAAARKDSEPDSAKPTAEDKAPEQKTIVASRPEAKEKPSVADQSSSAAKLQKEAAKKQDVTEPRKPKTAPKKVGKKSVSATRSKKRRTKKSRSKKSRKSKTRKSRTASKRKYRTARKSSRAQTVRLHHRHRDFFDHRRKHQSRRDAWHIAHEKRMRKWRQEMRKRRDAHRRSMARHWRQEKRQQSNLPLCVRR